MVPEFKDITPDDISIEYFTEGITNKIVCVTNKKNNFKVNVRTYGAYTEYIIDRSLELIVMDNCPKIKVYGTFLNGLIYSYIEGRTIDINDLKNDEKTFKQTAQAIAGHHRLTPPIKKVPILFINLRKWLCNVPLEYLDEKLKPPYDINIIKQELIFLEENLKNRSDIVFCHNDLLLKKFYKK